MTLSGAYRSAHATEGPFFHTKTPSGTTMITRERGLYSFLKIGRLQASGCGACQRLDPRLCLGDLGSTSPVAVE